MDAIGNGVAVSQRYVRSAVHDIVAARYVTGRGWDAPVTVTAERNSVQSLQVAMDPAGNALAIWHEGEPGETFGVWAARFAIGAGWGRPVLLQANVGSIVEAPRIARDTEGNGAAVWSRIEADRFNVYAARFNFDGGWGTPEIIGSSPRAGTIFSGIGAPVVAMGPGGEAVACWSQQESGRNVIWASRFDHGRR
jgi:hypothetical protein